MATKKTKLTQAERRKNWRPRFLIRDARLKAALTQRELAEQLGVAQSHIAAWETGVKTPSWGCLCEIAHVLDLAVVSELVDASSRFDEDYRGHGAGSAYRSA